MRSEYPMVAAPFSGTDQEDLEVDLPSGAIAYQAGHAAKLGHDPISRHRRRP
jgi:hypothetical protein